MNIMALVFEGNDVRVIEKDQVAWVVAKDVCEVLGIKNHSDAVSRLSNKQKSVLGVSDPHGRTQNTAVINEAGIYKLVFRSNKPQAERFGDWVSEEVLPSIRKTGSYQMETPVPQTPLEVIQMAVNRMVEQEQRINNVEKDVKNISGIFAMNNVEWRKKVDSLLKRIANNWTGVDPYRSVRTLSYERLENRAGCKLDVRLNNRKERAAAKGMSKSYVQKINKMDVIEEEKRLKEIYIQVVKEMAIQHRVNLDDMEDVI